MKTQREVEEEGDSRLISAIEARAREIAIDEYPDSPAERIILIQACFSMARFVFEEYERCMARRNNVEMFTDCDLERDLFGPAREAGRK